MVSTFNVEEILLQAQTYSPRSLAHRCRPGRACTDQNLRGQLVADLSAWLIKKEKRLWVYSAISWGRFFVPARMQRRHQMQQSAAERRNHVFRLQTGKAAVYPFLVLQQRRQL